MPRSSLPPPSVAPLMPRVRGRYMQTFAAHIGRLPVADRDAIAAAVPAEIWSEISGAGALSWLPFERNLVCTRAVAQVLGMKRTDEFFLSLLLTTFKTPLLQSLVDAIIRMLGSDPSVSLGWVSRGFELMFKDAGTWRVDGQSDGSASLVVTGLPSVAILDRVWLQSVASSLGALFSIAGVEGATTIRDVDVTTGSVAFRMRWDHARD